MKRILLVGGCGYVGSWIAKKLGPRAVKLGRGCGDLRGDITDPGQCREVLSDGKFDAVVWAAGSGRLKGPTAERDAFRVNVESVAHVLKALQDSGITRVIRFSTFHVYGAEGGEVNELSVPEPTHFYGLSHLLGEEATRFYAKQMGAEATILRLTNAYGAPAQQTGVSWELAMNDLCRQAVEKGEISLRGNGRQERDMIWLGDVSWVVERLLMAKQAAAGVFNLASGQTFSMNALAERVASAYERRTGRKPPIARLSQAGPSGSSDLRVDSSRLSEAIGARWHDRIESEAEAIWNSLER